jgi:hypothetical protein
MINENTLKAILQARTNIDLAAKAIGLLDEVMAEECADIGMDSGMKAAAAFKILEDTINPLGHLIYQLAETAEELGSKPEH